MGANGSGKSTLLRILLGFLPVWAGDLTAREYDRGKGWDTMARTEKVELTALCLVYREDAYLLQNRVKEDWKGYTLPGGHIEAGESIVHAIVREMKEETGLTILSPKLCGVKQFPIEDGRYLVFLFSADKYEGELVSSEEGEMRWIRKEELSSVDLVSDFNELLQVMVNEGLNEFQYVIEDEEWKIVLR